MIKLIWLGKDNWMEGGGNFHDGKSTTFCSVDEHGNNHGFASMEGGRTPQIFLQELAHLASLCNAVMFSTLHCDVEGVELLLDISQCKFVCMATNKQNK